MSGFYKEKNVDIDVEVEIEHEDVIEYIEYHASNDEKREILEILHDEFNNHNIYGASIKNTQRYHDLLDELESAINRGVDLRKISEIIKIL